MSSDVMPRCSHPDVSEEKLISKIAKKDTEEYELIFALCSTGKQYMN
jgi:hypothetical protein